MYWTRYFFTRLIFLILFTGLQACGSGGDSPDNSGGGSPTENSTSNNGGGSTNEGGSANNGGSTNGGSTSNADTGQALYAAQCANCHGSSGQGVSSIPGVIGCSTCGDHDTLASDIETTMPPSNIGLCDATCSSLIADYILAEFNSGTSSGGSSSGGGSTTGGSNAGVIFSETFEDGDLDTQPAGWDNFLDYNYNTNNSLSNDDYALIDDTYAYNGSQSIHFKGDLAQIVRALPANTQRVYLRAYVRMSKQMGNMPRDTDNHEHIMGIKKTQDANNEVRIGQIKGVLGTNETSTDNIAPKGDQWWSGTELAPNTWYCLETGLYADTAYDEVHLWVDGVEVHSITSGADWNNGALGNDWMSDKFNYAMFGFQSFSGNTADVWMDDIVVSTQPIGCEGVPSTGGGSTSDGGSSTTADATHGASLFSTQCSNCHGVEGAEPRPIVTTKSTYGSNNQNLADYISDNMVNDPASCDAACVADITAYIESWTTGGGSDGGSDPVVASCSGKIGYGPRELKLLTRVEYQNSMEDLTGIDFNVSDSVPYDALIEGYFNNAFTPVTESHADSYTTIAEKVASWSAQRNFQGVVDCGFDGSGNSSVSYDECKTRFLNDFATRVFRRPLSSAEQATYQAVFNNNLTGGDIKVGLKLGMSSLLSSPQFLYRSEVGTSVQDLQSGGGSVASGDGVTVNGADFQTKSTGGADGSGWNIWSDGYIENSFELADEALLQISMKGDPAQSVWPTMELVIDGTTVATQTVDSNSYMVYEFSVNGKAGQRQVQIKFTNDSYQNGEDRNLYVQSATVSGIQSGSNSSDAIDLTALDSDAYVLSDYEMAGFLSYTITGSTPDAQLLTAAKNGELVTAAQLQQQAERLLATDRAKQHLGVFAAQWLASDEVLKAQKDSTLFPDFTDDVRKAMAAEVKAFFTHVFYAQDQGFTDLFDADYVFVNKPLASYYGLGNVGSDSSDPADMIKVDATSIHRGGLLTMGSFLANYADLTKSSPIKRAINIRKRLLCQDPPSPDATIASFRAEKADELINQLNGQLITNRDFVAAITKETPCSTCHDKIINPLGFGLEDYDAAGLYRTIDSNGLSIDASGILYGVNELFDSNTVSFQGAKDLSNQFADLEPVQSCFSANVFRFAMNIGHDAIDAANANRGGLTDEEKQDYSCSVDTLSETLASSNSMANLFSRLSSLSVIRFRKQRDR